MPQKNIKTHLTRSTVGFLTCNPAGIGTQAEAAEGGDLFRTQFAADLQFGLNSHAQLRCLGGGEVVYSLFDEVFVDWICIERLVESETRMAYALIGRLPLVFVLGKDAADPLALFGREAELLDRIGGPERLNGILRPRACLHEEQDRRHQRYGSKLHFHLTG